MSVAPVKALPLARALSAALLTLALLASAVPFTALSASHSCSMPCCEGVEGGCATGACAGALVKSPKKTEEEKLCGAEVASQSHGGDVKSHAATPAEESEHCDSENKATAPLEQEPSAAQSTAKPGEKQTSGFLSARALSAPCAKDCCAVANASTQGRRGRDLAFISAAGRDERPAFISPSLYSRTLQPVSSVHLNGLRERGPPSLISTDPA